VDAAFGRDNPHDPSAHAPVWSKTGWLDEEDRFSGRTHVPLGCWVNPSACSCADERAGKSEAVAKGTQRATSEAARTGGALSGGVGNHEQAQRQQGREFNQMTRHEDNSCYLRAA
jgi:hypothetical protein